MPSGPPCRSPPGEQDQRGDLAVMDVPVGADHRDLGLDEGRAIDVHHGIARETNAPHLVQGQLGRPPPAQRTAPMALHATTMRRYPDRPAAILAASAPPAASR